jgi:hypothetical protein
VTTEVARIASRHSVAGQKYGSEDESQEQLKKTRQPHVVSFGIYVLIDPRHEKLGNPMAG